jgi:uncharacterized phage protein (TIGR01671 family)
MREILFRGKRKDNGEWVYGYYSELPIGSLGATIFAGSDEIICEDTASYIISVFSKQHSNFSFGNPLEVVEAETYEVDRETIGQYTGLTDCKGNKIFEGDILKCLTDDFVGTVIYNKNTASFIVEIKNSNSEFFHYSSLNKGDITRPLQLQETESVGNIHDNAELLEMQDD